MRDLIQRLEALRDKGINPDNREEYFKLQEELDSEPLTVQQFMDDSSVTLNKSDWEQRSHNFNAIFGVK